MVIHMCRDSVGKNVELIRLWITHGHVCTSYIVITSCAVIITLVITAVRKS